MSEFAAPAAAGGIDMNDHNGHLVIIEVHSYETEVQTANGPRDAVRVTFHDVDQHTTADDILLFPKIIVGSLKGRIGQKVLARVGQGVAKPGQNAPWILNDASADTTAVAAATAHLEAWKAGQFTAPTPAAPAAAAAQVDLADPNVQAALAALAAQQKAPF